MTHSFDVIVLGAGAMGSAATYYLAKAGQRVLCLEQFDLNHCYGSSYGVSRIIRYSYDHPTYITLMKAVYPLWFALEEEAGETLYTKTGGIDFGLPDKPSLRSTSNSLRVANISYETLTTTQATQRFPQFCFDEDMVVFYQADAGILAASRCVLAHLRLAQAKGAVVQANTPVHSDSLQK